MIYTKMHYTMKELRRCLAEARAMGRPTAELEAELEYRKIYKG